MPNTDFLPSRDAELLAFTANFASKINATPGSAATYGLTPAQATSYQTAQSQWSNALGVATNPATRSPMNIAAKDTARDAIIAQTRTLARLVQAAPAVTPAQRVDLGLRQRDVDPTPVPVPAISPAIDIVSANGWTVKLRLHDPATPNRRARPVGVTGATIFSFVGPNPPTNVADWKFEGNYSNTSAGIQFATTLAPGTKVWFTAFWYNPRGKSGPGTAPVSALISGSGMEAA